MGEYGFECKRCGERVTMPAVAANDIDIVRVAMLRRHAEACYAERDRNDGVAFDDLPDDGEGDH
jgi:hypothetical protein